MDDSSLEIAMLRRLAEQHPLHQYVKDVDGNIIFNNRSTPPAADLIPAPEEHPNDYVVECRDDAGQPHWIRVITETMTDDEGKTIGTIGCELDITESVLNKDALKHERQLLNSILQNVPDRIYFKDLDSRFIRVSKELEKISGVDNSEDLIGKTDADVFSADHASKARMDELAVINTGEAVIELEEEELLKDGRSVWLSTSKAPLYNEEGEIIGTMGISRNISRMKELETQHIQVIKDLETALGQVKKLSGMVPICSYCKSIRNDEGYWNTIEDYIHEHSEAEFSHGICDCCLGKHFPDIKNDTP